MKKIINGKKYDTTTAMELGRAKSQEGISDFGRWEEIIYRKRTGEFFLSGQGNASSKYSELYEGGGRGAGSRLVPLSMADEKEWVELYANDRYEDIFGEAQE